MTKTVFKETETYLRPDDTRSNRYMFFDVPEGTGKLLITYSYSPKNLENKEKSYELIRENILRDAPEDIDRYTDYEEFLPLKNLVTVSLDSPVEFRGAAHRHDKEQYHEISKDFASPGFLRSGRAGFRHREHVIPWLPGNHRNRSQLSGAVRRRYSEN